MPISKAHRMVFIHIPKTGGSSIEHALGIRGAANSGSDEPVPELVFGKLEGVHLQHLTLRQLRDRGHLEGSAGDYFRFAIVRDPWDRMVSEFEYQRGLGVLAEYKVADFDGFMDAIEEGRFDDHVHFRPQTDFLTDDAGNIAVDRVGRFERLATEFRSICLAAGVDAPSLPMLKQTRHGHYADYYNERTREIVAHRFAEDLDRFGYRFQESTLWLRLQRPVTLARHRIDQVLHR